MIDLRPVITLALLLVRPGVLISVASLFGGASVPPHVKIGLTVLTAAVLTPSVAAPSIAGAIPLALIVAHEAAVGFALGLAANAFIAGVELAGYLCGFQIGLSYGGIVDPQSGVRNGLLAALYGNMALVALLLANAHHAFFRTLVASYDSVPMEIAQAGAGTPAAVMALLGLMFRLGARLAAPVVIVLVLGEIAMALVARTAPMLNLMVLGAPVRLLVGLILLALTVAAVARVAGSAAPGILDVGEQAARAFR